MKSIFYFGKKSEDLIHVTFHFSRIGEAESEKIYLELGEAVTSPDIDLVNKTAEADFLTSTSIKEITQRLKAKSFHIEEEKTEFSENTSREYNCLWVIVAIIIVIYLVSKLFFK